MKNRFNINESEKSRIRELHGINPIYEQFSGSRWPEGFEETFNIDEFIDENGVETVRLSNKQTAPQDQDGCYRCLLRDPRIIKMIDEDGLQLTMEDGMCACFLCSEVSCIEDCSTKEECCNDNYGNLWCKGTGEPFTNIIRDTIHINSNYIKS